MWSNGLPRSFMWPARWSSAPVQSPDQVYGLRTLPDPRICRRAWRTVIIEPDASPPRRERFEPINWYRMEIAPFMKPSGLCPEGFLLALLWASRGLRRDACFLIMQNAEASRS